VVPVVIHSVGDSVCLSWVLVTQTDTSDGVVFVSVKVVVAGHDEDSAATEAARAARAIADLIIFKTIVMLGSEEGAVSVKSM